MSFVVLIEQIQPIQAFLFLIDKDKKKKKKKKRNPLQLRCQLEPKFTEMVFYKVPYEIVLLYSDGIKTFPPQAANLVSI